MSAVLAPRTQAPERGAGRLTGTGSLLRFLLRRDRVRLPSWAIGLGVFAVYTATALRLVYPTAADRQGRAALLSGPAGVLLSGPGYGRDDYTLGAMIANEVGLTLVIATSIMSILLVVRHTRAEEESGRADLVGSAAVARHAPLTAALALVAIANAAVCAVVALGLAASGLAPVDSIAFGAGIGLTGLVFGAVAAVAAQTTEYARGATGLAVAVLGAAAVVRGVGDVLETGGSALSWLSPIAWAQQTRAYVDLRWSPLLLSVAVIAVLVPAAYRLASRRDTGAGLRAPRRGPEHGGALLSGAGGLTVRLQRASALAWGVGALVFAVVLGSLTRSATDVVAGNERLAALLEARGGGDLRDTFVSLAATEIALLVVAFGVASVLRLRGEEAAGRVEVLLATALDRRRLLATSLATAAGACLVILVVAGLGAGLAAAAATEDATFVPRVVGSFLVLLPAVLVVVGVAAALVGVAPRRASLAWVLVGWVVLVGLFGPLLQLPDALLKTSPLSWVPAVPAEPLDVVPLGVLTLVAAGLAAVALLGYRRRDVPA